MVSIHAQDPGLFYRIGGKLMLAGLDRRLGGVPARTAGGQLMGLGKKRCPLQHQARIPARGDRPPQYRAARPHQRLESRGHRPPRARDHRVQRLGEFIDLPFKTYSQGMAARLAFAAATSFEPEILLMDEWLGAGDPGFQDRARERVQAMTAKAGIIVLASHSHALLQRTCNKVLELEKGEVSYFGDAAPYFEARSTPGGARSPAKQQAK